MSLTLSPDVTVAWAGYLAGVAEVAAQVEGRIGEKVDGTFPALRFTEIATSDAAEVDGWADALVQIDCFHTTRADAADLARTVCAALNAAANHTAGGVALGRARAVKRWAAHDTTYDPPQPRWIVAARLFAKPA